MKKTYMMKKFFYLFLSFSLFVAACSKNEDPLKEEPSGDIEDPTGIQSFNVKLEGKQVFKVGERVVFSIEGDAESIDFFSGQEGHQYEHRGGKIVASGMSLNFSLHTAEPRSPGFFIMVSTDFNGNYSNFEAVTHAQQNWKDITDRVTFPPASVYASAGPIDLSDLTVVGKPFYFAIKYVTKLNSLGNPVPWTVRLTEWRSLLPSGSEIIGRMTPQENTMGFQVVQENSQYSTVVSANSAGDVVDRFGITGNRNAPDAETWIISKEFADIQEIMGDADVPIPIKSAGNSRLPSYNHVYTAPGTYTAHFVATILDDEGERKEEVKEISVIIED